jgi:ribosome-associated protein
MNVGAAIDPAEFAFQFTRSGGPGGQNVNKVNTRVTLRFHVEASGSLTPAQKLRIRDRLAARIGRDGALRVVSSRHRTQVANRKAAVERLIELLAEALAEDKPRRKTKVPAAARRRRAEDKQRQSERKQQRGGRHREHD